MHYDRILFIDTETGGIDPQKHSLLSIALVVWENFKIINSKEILINDGILCVTEKALEINKIDIEEHKKNAFESQKALLEINTFLNANFVANEKITLAGHNINFDVNFLKQFSLKNHFNFNERFSHRYVDTSSILYYLYLSGKLKEKAISSQQAFELFGIKIDNRHSALGDALGTAKLFSTLLQLIYKKAKINKSVSKHQTNLFE